MGVKYLQELVVGFKEGALVACCGAGGPYNFNASVQCGYPPTKGCDDPNLYANWDGIHLTEAAYKWLANGILTGAYTDKNLNIMSTSYISAL